MHTLKYIINNINSQEQPIVYRLESEQKTSATGEKVYECVFGVLHTVEVWDILTSTMRSNKGTKKARTYSNLSYCGPRKTFSE